MTKVWIQLWCHVLQGTSPVQWIWILISPFMRLYWHFLKYYPFRHPRRTFRSFWMALSPNLHSIYTNYPMYSLEKFSTSHSLPPPHVISYMVHLEFLLINPSSSTFPHSLSNFYFMAWINRPSILYHSQVIPTTQDPTTQFSWIFPIFHQLLGRGPTLLFASKTQPQTLQFPKLGFTDVAVC